MSKSMAIDAIMKLFLMIAVIIVGMSFLLKAFGIDLIGWLMDKFAGLGVPDKEKILYLKLDPGDKPLPEVFSIYIDRNPIQKIEHSTAGGLITVGRDNYFAYFMVDSSPTVYRTNCIIYTVDEIGLDSQKPDTRDEAFVYYVKPGTLFQDSCKSLQNCLSGKVVTKNCNQEKENTKNLGDTRDCTFIREGLSDKCYTSKKGVFSAVNCYCESGPSVRPEALCEDSRRDVETFVFGNTINRVEDCKLKDGRPQTPSKCNLLVPEDRFIIKSGLLCDNEGLWRTCKEDNKGQTTPGITIGSNKYTCNVGDKNIGTWSLVP